MLTPGVTAYAFIFLVDTADAGTDADVDVDAQNFKLTAVYRNGNVVAMKITKKTYLAFATLVTAITA